MKSSGNDGSSKVDRKTVERNRRIHMKNLCFKLGSIIPKEYKNTKDAMAQHDYLDEAVSYISNLKERIEKLKQRKRPAVLCQGSDNEVDCEVDTNGSGPPVVEVRYRNSILEVVLTSGPKKRFKFYQVIGVLVEEGADVVNASFSVVNDKIFYTIHSQVIGIDPSHKPPVPQVLTTRPKTIGDKVASLMANSSMTVLDASRVSERLKELIR